MGISSTEAGKALAAQRRFASREVVCLECGQSFTAKTSRAKYCGNTCTVRAWRKANGRKKVQRAEPPRAPLEA